MYFRGMYQFSAKHLTPSWKVLLAYAVGGVLLDALSHPKTLLPLALTPWTPPPGLTLAFLLLFGVRYWPWLALMTVLAAIPVNGWPPDWLATLLVASFLVLSYAGLTLWLLRGLKIDPAFRSLRDLSWFLVAAAIVAWIDAGVHVLSNAGAEGTDTAATWFADLVNFWVSDLIRVLVLAPLVLVFARVDWRGWRPSKEMVAQALAILLALWVIFGLKYTDEFKFFYLLFLPLIWIAMRHGLQGATLALATIHLGLNAILEWLSLHAITVVEFQMLMLGLAVTGLFLGMTVSVRQATEERLHQREAELNQAMRLAAAGEMAQAIAHELNQPLSALTNYARASRSMLEQPDQHGPLLADTLQKIDREATRAGQVMRRLRGFFRGGGLRLENLPVTVLIEEEGLGYIRRRAERLGVVLHVAVAADLPMVRVDRVQIGTVLHNLLVNALESLASQGSVWREIEVAAQQMETGWVQVCISDTGQGVTTDMQQRLFESFATSKDDGMGLGLAISRTLVEAHGGQLWLDKAMPARFCFTMPVDTEKPA